MRISSHLLRMLLLTLVLGAALLPAQQQPRAVIDPIRTMEARYEVDRPWWDPARGTPLAPSKDCASCA